jgi:hypothetical protein
MFRVVSIEGTPPSLLQAMADAQAALMTRRAPTSCNLEYARNAAAFALVESGQPALPRSSSSRAQKYPVMEQR